MFNLLFSSSKNAAKLQKNKKKCKFILVFQKKRVLLHAFSVQRPCEVWKKKCEKAPGTLAQVVEQWTENPCVLGSTPRGTTKRRCGDASCFLPLPADAGFPDKRGHLRVQLQEVPRREDAETHLFFAQKKQRLFRRCFYVATLL